MIHAGTSAKFAVESHIEEVLESDGLLALGYFVIYVKGVRYGVKAPDATALACSLDSVQSRISGRGTFAWPYVANDAAAIANAYLNSVHKGVGSGWEDAVARYVDEHGLLLAPDGDEAFDDGSYIIHAEQGELSRIIAFRNGPAQVDDLSEVQVPSKEFYQVLDDWRTKFLEELSVISRSAHRSRGMD